MAYYDRISRQWHQATGFRGGAFKELALNEVLLRKIPGIHDRAILELGAGNGYLMPLILRRFSGQTPSVVFVTDISSKQLEIAQTHFRIPSAQYQLLDVRRPFSFANDSIDLILAMMILNEVQNKDLRQAIAECRRILSPEGLLLIAVTHPKFVSGLQRRGLLRHTGGTLTMPGAGNLRLPVVVRSVEIYRDIFDESGFKYEEEEVYATNEVINVKSGLRKVGNAPLALMWRCARK